MSELFGRRPRLLAAASVAAGLLATAATPAAAQAMKTMDMPAPTSGAPAQGSAADQAFMASMAQMMKAMDLKPTGDPDRDFVAMMMPHHQGAIAMAEVELRYGKDPMLRRLAGEIVKAQAIEIGDMKAWQAKHAGK